MINSRFICYIKTLREASVGKRYAFIVCNRIHHIAKQCSQHERVRESNLHNLGSSKYSFNSNQLYLSTDERNGSALAQFEAESEETLDELTGRFEEIIDQCDHLMDSDVSYESGVLTVSFGSPYGTYVINKQTPNQQIWLSSPRSGPKRYDLVNGQWIYKHDGKALRDLLSEEISIIAKTSVSFK